MFEFLRNTVIFAVMGVAGTGLHAHQRRVDRHDSRVAASTAVDQAEQKAAPKSLSLADKREVKRDAKRAAKHEARSKREDQLRAQLDRHTPRKRGEKDQAGETPGAKADSAKAEKATREHRLRNRLSKRFTRSGKADTAPAPAPGKSAQLLPVPETAAVARWHFPLGG
jgi:hypothetical protein